MNALKHGGTAALGLLPDEDFVEQARFIERMFNRYNPTGPEEEALVELIADGMWRLRRFSRAEAGVMAWYVYERLRMRVDEESSHYPSNPDNSAAARKAKIRKLQEDIPYAAQAFLADAEGADVLSKLSRYETTIVNRVMRAMKELRELRAGRIETAS